ncbi:diguanylate cyclase [Vibrio parahaemolyticus]|nr:diguanylate cyclase [Vibrio parahaemolyticus]
MLKKDYALLKEYNFRQLHFHFKNGDSFLRVHKPEKFGDNLFSIRESVRLANVEERFVEGFEEGRIFNGYRFVYPVVDHDKQVGTLEVSLSMGSIVDLLFELYPDDDFHFIINKSTVESKLFDDMAYNYLNSFLSDNYYFDKAVFEQHLPKIKYRDLLDNADTLKKSLSSLTLNEHSFSHDITIGDNTYILSFLSIKNIKGEHVAYLISSTQDARLKELCNNYLIYLLLILLVSAVTAWSIFASHRHNQRLTTASNTDFLTQVFNRNKFTEHLQYEFVQGKNLTSTFSIILFDVDHFKSINDQFGHNVGDIYLKELSELVSNRIRHSDILARWGAKSSLFYCPTHRKITG